MKKFSKPLFLFFLMALFAVSLMSCADDVQTQKTDSSVSSKALYEMEKLASEDELNRLATRGDDDIVDWELSKEFAQLWLESGIEAGDYPANSELWEIPIAVYDADGEIQYYEFRVTSEGNVVAAITGAARKSFGCPILYEFSTEGYADEITELYNSGKFSSETMPRVVDNGYPTIVFGTTTITRGTDDGFDGFLNPETGDKVNEEDIATLLTYEEAKKICPDMLPEDIDDAKMQALIEDFKKNGEEFWKLAVANKGHIADFAVRGGSKSKPREAVDSDRIKNVRKYLYNHAYSVSQKDYRYNSYRYLYGTACYPYGNGACGPVATGFILDFIAANNIQTLTAWNNLSMGQRGANLRSLMNTGESFGGIFENETYPWKLNNSVNSYSSYRVVRTSKNYPKTSINNNMPGLSLRIFGKGFAHYRPVVAYKLEGWWAFSWPYNKILDLVDAGDKVNGSWEAWRPLMYNYDIIKY